MRDELPWLTHPRPRLRRSYAFVVAAFTATLAMVACRSSDPSSAPPQPKDDKTTPSPAPATEAVAYTSVDQVFSEPVFEHCEKAADLSVRGLYDTEETKSTGVLNRLLAEASHPQADVFWSGDPVRSFVLVDKGLVEPYRSPAATGLPSSLRADDGTWTGFAARARVLLVNQKLVPEDGPSSIRDLANPKWKGRAAIANPLFGTTTMHVAAWVATWGQEATKDFLDQLKKNEVRIASSNGEVKRLVSSGEVAFGLTDTDDANGGVLDGF